MQWFLSHLLFADDELPWLILISSCPLCPRLGLLFLAIYPALNVLRLLKACIRLLPIYTCTDYEQLVLSPLSSNADNVYAIERSTFWGVQ